MEPSKEIYEIRRISVTVESDGESEVRYNVAELATEDNIHVTDCSFRTEDCFVPYKE